MRVVAAEALAFIEHLPGGHGGARVPVPEPEHNVVVVPSVSVGPQFGREHRANGYESNAIPAEALAI
jgi:hypothetical protein